MRKNRKRVPLCDGLVRLPTPRGIAKYALEHDWHLARIPPRRKSFRGLGRRRHPRPLGRGDDLADLGHARPQNPRWTSAIAARICNTPRVLVDHTAVAHLATEHFPTRGHRNFAFYSDVNNWVYEENGKGFAALKEAGQNGEWICWHRFAQLHRRSSSVETQTQLARGGAQASPQTAGTLCRERRSRRRSLGNLREPWTAGAG